MKVLKIFISWCGHINNVMVVSAYMVVSSKLMISSCTHMGALLVRGHMILRSASLEDGISPFEAGHV